MHTLRQRSYLLLFAFLLTSSASAATPKQASKTGAGLLLCAAGTVLLLKRDSKHHDSAWTLPGGNVEDTDSSLLGTAAREAREELGGLPPFEIKAQILTKRGKKQEKHFTVFVAEVPASAAAGFVPQLSDEHSDWRWMPWADVTAGAAGQNTKLLLHPVVTTLAEQHVHQVTNAAGACGLSAHHR